MAGLTPLEEPDWTAGRKSGFALWQLGFRPFYLLAATFAEIDRVVTFLTLS